MSAYARSASSPTPESTSQCGGSSGLWRGGIVLLVIGALVVVSLVIHKVHISQSADRVEIETPVGAIKVNQDEAHATGLPVYPGATAQKSQGANFEVSANGNSRRPGNREISLVGFRARRAKPGTQSGSARLPDGDSRRRTTTIRLTASRRIFPQAISRLWTITGRRPRRSR